MTIDHPAHRQIPQLWQLWKDTFSDTDSFLDAFFTTAFRPDRCLCAAEAQTVLGAVYWLDCFCRGEKLAYVYALAVRQDCRGRGIGSRLMEHVHGCLEKGGYQGVLLVPQEEGLVRMYEKLGYRPGTAIREFTCRPGPNAAALQRVDGLAFARLRREYLPDGGVLQEGEDLAFLQTQAAFYAGEDFLLAARQEGSRLFALELLGNGDAAPGILRSLNCMEGSFRTPGKERSFAMFRPLAPDCHAPAYFAFAFD